MKLLAVVAIGVIVCLGTPDVGSARSWPKTECEKIESTARLQIYKWSENSEKILELFKKDHAYIGTNPLDPQKSEELANIRKERDELSKQSERFRTAAAQYAQIYSAFCK